MSMFSQVYKTYTFSDPLPPQFQKVYTNIFFKAKNVHQNDKNLP